MNRKSLLLFFLTLVLILIFILAQDESDADVQIYKSNIMGTSYSVTIHSKVDSQNTFFQVSNILNEINQDMSTYIDNSLISRVNQSKIGQWTKVSKDFIEVLNYAIEICNQSKGIYDVSIGKLVNLWGFGPDNVNSKPSKDNINYLTSQVGCDSVQTNVNSQSVRKVRDVELDFSSIAKGFAIDKVYEFLVNKEEVESFFIELGGEVRSTSRKSNSQPWKVGIINPLEPSKIIHTFFSSDYLSFAMATSGDYRNIRIFDDMEMSHTIDPVSGVPSEYSKKSVSVISTSGMSADALSTTLNVMPLQEAIEFANTKKLKVLFVLEEEGSPKLIFSEELQRVKI